MYYFFFYYNYNYYFFSNARDRARVVVCKVIKSSICKYNTDNNIIHQLIMLYYISNIIYIILYYDNVVNLRLPV